MLIFNYSNLNDTHVGQLVEKLHHTSSIYPARAFRADEVHVVGCGELSRVGLEALPDRSQGLYGDGSLRRWLVYTDSNELEGPLYQS